MIARLWRGRAADAAKADAYVRHFTGTVIAELKGLAGHRGAWLLRREVDGRRSSSPSRSGNCDSRSRPSPAPTSRSRVVEPEARAVLADVRRLRQPLRGGVQERLTFLAGRRP